MVDPRVGFSLPWRIIGRAGNTVSGSSLIYLEVIVARLGALRMEHPISIKG